MSSTDQLIQKLTLLVRDLKPYEMIEISLEDNLPGRVQVVVKYKVKETFRT